MSPIDYMLHQPDNYMIQLAHLHTVTGSELSLILLATPVLFLLRQVKVSAKKGSTAIKKGHTVV